MKKITKIILFLFMLNTVSYSSSLRIEIKELVNNLSSYKILDVRDKNKFEDLHIKGALNFSASLTYNNFSIDGKISEPNKMQKIIRN